MSARCGWRYLDDAIACRCEREDDHGFLHRARIEHETIAAVQWGNGSSHAVPPFPTEAIEVE